MSSQAPGKRSPPRRRGRPAGGSGLVLLGIATSGVVLSTVRHAFDADYDLTVVEDCCIDADPQLHRVLLDKVIGRQARLVTAAGFDA